MIAPLLWSVPLELRSEEQRVNSGVVAHSEVDYFSKETSGCAVIQAQCEFHPAKGSSQIPYNAFHRRDPVYTEHRMG